MAVKRLNIEIPWEQYDILRREAAIRGTSISSILRRLIEDLERPKRKRGARARVADPFLSRKGSFDGPADLAEKHDAYLYGGRR